MSASHTCTLRALLSGSSLLTVLVMVGTGAATLTPSAVMAANECAPGTAATLATPGDNGATADTYICNGSYSAITYTTDGVFTLRLQNNATTTTGGVTIVGATGNNITVNRLADSPAASGDPSLTSTSGAALSVTNSGGNITASLTDPSNDWTVDEPMILSGTSAGVLLHNTGGAGTTSFNSNNGTISASAGSGIDVTSAGTGNVTVGTGSVVSASAWGIRAGSGSGNVTITNGNTVSSIIGTVTGGTGAIYVTGGANVTITNAARSSLNGIVTLNNTGTVNFKNEGIWTWAGASSLGIGDTTLTNNALRRIVTSGASTLDFAGGEDIFVNAGALAAGAGPEGASTLTLLGLETWNNSGSVIFGESVSWLSDGVPNDRIAAAGTLFTGSGDSLLIMDVDLSADQADCTAAVTADCFDLRGGSTAGSTSVLVNVVSGSQGGVAERVVLVDVAGAGTSGAGHFILSEDSAGYRSIGGTGAVEGGLFFYTLDYDATAQQHVLAQSAFGGKALELSRISRAASEPWRTVTSLWHDRQMDLRDAVTKNQTGPAAWIKLANNDISHKGLDDLHVGTDQLAYNLGARQNTTALVGGVDLMRLHRDDQAVVFGLTAGQVDSTVDYRVGTSKLDLEGYSVGAYASFVSGRLFVDAIVNSTSMDLTHKDGGQGFTSSAKALGYQLETGYRLFQVNEGGAYVEPLAALSYVKTSVDDLHLGPASASFDDGTSLRAGLGLRMAGDWETDLVTARLGVTGRIWRDLDGERTTTLRASFGEADFIDQDVDTLSDIGVAVGLFRPGGNLSANIAYSLKFADDYKSSDASLSVRWLW
jgi:hypothetical protein